MRILRAAATSAFAALAVIVVFAAATTAQATIVVRASVEEMTDVCRRCVYGTVRGKSVAFDREKGEITTTWALRVDETFLGENAADLALTVRGGTIPKAGTNGADLSQDYVGAPRFAEGERVVVFLWKDAAGRLQVLGEAQGSFRVTHDERLGEDVCENRVEGLSFVDRAGKAASAEPTKLTLRDMRRRVADARTARETREKAAREALERRLEAMRRRAEENTERARGRPGAPPEK